MPRRTLKDASEPVDSCNQRHCAATRECSRTVCIDTRSASAIKEASHARRHNREEHPSPDHVGAAGAAATPLDLNSASMAELEALPGIGAAKAAAIIEERQVRPFADVDDLERVRGIGPALLAELRPQVTVSASAPKKAQ